MKLRKVHLLHQKGVSLIWNHLTSAQLIFKNTPEKEHENINHNFYWSPVLLCSLAGDKQEPSPIYNATNRRTQFALTIFKGTLKLFEPYQCVSSTKVKALAVCCQIYCSLFFVNSVYCDRDQWNVIQCFYLHRSSLLQLHEDAHFSVRCIFRQELISLFGYRIDRSYSSEIPMCRLNFSFVLSHRLAVF